MRLFAHANEWVGLWLLDSNEVDCVRMADLRQRVRFIIIFIIIIIIYRQCSRARLPVLGTFL